MDEFIENFNIFQDFLKDMFENSQCQYCDNVEQIYWKFEELGLFDAF